MSNECSKCEQFKDLLIEIENMTNIMKDISKENNSIQTAVIDLQHKLHYLWTVYEIQYKLFNCVIKD